MTGGSERSLPFETLPSFASPSEAMIPLTNASTLQNFPQKRLFAEARDFLSRQPAKWQAAKLCAELSFLHLDAN